MSTNHLTEHYNALQKECGINIGDTVKVLRAAKHYELGWGTTWEEEMSLMVGKTLKVVDIQEDDGIYLEDGLFYPFFVLEVVKKGFTPINVVLNDSYTAVVHPDKVVVGCQEFKPDAILALADAVKRATKNRSKK